MADTQANTVIPAETKDDSRIDNGFIPVPSAPSHLIPDPHRPIDPCYYKTLHITEMAGPDGTREIDRPLDPMTVGGATGSMRAAQGVLLTHEQAWRRKGLALGNLLHSLCLTPGEITKVAMIDWHHSSRGVGQQATTQQEALSRAGEQARAIAEVTKGTAQESLHGASTDAAQSSSVQGGVGGGLGGFLGFSGGGGSNASIATHVGFSDGSRSVSEAANQQVHQRTHEQADATRTRRATVITETTEADNEVATTRIVANYNHGHALTTQYFEVLETYDLETRIIDAQRCLFLPLALFDFSDPRVLHRYRPVIERVAHNDEVRNKLKELKAVDDRVTVEINPEALVDFGKLGTHVKNERPEVDAVPFLYETKLRTYRQAPLLTIPGANGDDNLTFTVPGDARIVSFGEDSFPAELGGLRQAGILTLNRRNAGPNEISQLKGIADPNGVTLADAVELSFLPNPLAVGASPENLLLLLRLQIRSSGGATASEPTLLAVQPTRERVSILTVKAPDRSVALALAELMAPYRLQYSQAIWASLDQVTIRELLADRSYGGQSLAASVVPVPIAITGNMVGFRWPFPAAQAQEGKSFRDSYMGTEAARSEIAIPTGGVYAESVLGESNASEPIDVTRFWKWQDAPIPFTPPEVSPVATTPRPQPGGVNTETGKLEGGGAQFSTAPALPAFTGTTELAKALIASNLFRDMSGNSAALAQAALQAATAGAAAGSKDAAKNYETYTAYLEKMAEQVLPLIQGALTDGASTGLTETMKGGLAAKDAKSAAAKTGEAGKKKKPAPTKTGGST